MKLVIVRHGQSEWNQKNLFTGWTDVPLSEKGIKESFHAGELLKEAGYDFDIAYTSYLKRAIATLNNILEVLDRSWIPVIKNWRLNERHYGSLQGLNKEKTAEKYGEEQVHIWRRSYDVLPPAMDKENLKAPRNMRAYRDVVNKDELPLHESLKETIERVVPYFEEEIKGQMEEGKSVIISAHGNSIRALVKYFDKLDNEEIMEVNIPTGIPLVYEFDDDFNATNHYYLGDQERVEVEKEKVKEQGEK
ncbi:MAG: 2,3-diphosphoglycerate-dependent phosphoglycerate mutase [Atopostipes suicloacalis]|nr:2,3-diphosphoglycerate-dependent phosphoglycerate mutase [Atopostipes suicloacalis]MDN6730545.1 2,3-diphosphoglycerate-dependent phosphoglycerate mutase [Atopostipes suicloacalis]